MSLALLLCAALVQADGEPEDWAGLDRELERILRVEAPPSGGPRPTVRLQIVGAGSTGEAYEVGPGVDERGVTLRQLQLGLRGEAGDFEYLFRVQAREKPRLQAARIGWRPVDGLLVRVGNLRLPIIHSRNVPRQHVMFIERSNQGRVLRRRDAGLEVEWAHPFVRALVGAHNGADGAGSDGLLIGRIEANVVGRGEVRHEYSPAVDAECVLVLGLGAAHEAALDEGTILIGDAVLVCRRLYLHGEVVHFGDGFVLGAVGTGPLVLAEGSAGRTAASGTVGFRFDELWDAGARFEWADDPNRTWSALLGVNRALPTIGARLQLNWTVQGSDAAANRGQRVALGLFWSI